MNPIRHISLRQVLALVPLGLLGLALVSTGSAVAGDGDQCASTRAANDLLHCVTCKQFKQLMKDPAVQGLDFQVHVLDHGVVVEIEGRSAQEAGFVRELAHTVWPAKECEGQLCSYCEDRMQHLIRASIDEANTEMGIIVVLTSEEDELSGWLREDAKQMQQFALRAANSH